MCCGGTVSSLFSVLQAQRMIARHFTPASIDRFKAAIFETESAYHLSKDRLPNERIKILPAGAAILESVFTELSIERMLPTFTSVGQGLIVNLILQRENK